MAFGLDVSHQILILVVYVLAVARVTRLINADTIMDWLRAIPMRRAHDARQRMNTARRSGQTDTAVVFERASRRWSTVLYFLECPWCVGMWACLATAWIPMFAYDVLALQYLGIALAASHLIGIFAFAANTEEVGVVDDGSA